MSTNAIIGQPLSRVDGPDKVTGGSRYSAEFQIPRLAHAAIVQSTSARGQIRRIDAAAAVAAPGVLLVLSHENAPRLPYNEPKQRAQVDPKSGDQLRVFQDTRIHFNGQPIAVVVAETSEEAQHAASLVQLEYEEEPAVTVFRADEAEPPSEANAKAGRPAEAGRSAPARA